MAVLTRWKFCRALFRGFRSDIFILDSELPARSPVISYRVSWLLARGYLHLWIINRTRATVAAVSQVCQFRAPPPPPYPCPPGGYVITSCKCLYAHCVKPTYSIILLRTTQLGIWQQGVRKWWQNVNFLVIISKNRKHLVSSFTHFIVIKVNIGQAFSVS